MKPITIKMIRESVVKLRLWNDNQPEFFKGVVHPLRYQWLIWDVDPMFSSMAGDAWGIKDQLKADYNGYGINAAVAVKPPFNLKGTSVGGVNE